MFARNLFLTALAVGVLAMACPAHAGTDTFLGSNTTADYATPASWDLGHVPTGSGEDGYILAGNTATLASDVAALLPRTLYIGEINGSATSGELDVNAGANLSVGWITAGFTGAGTVNQAAGTVTTSGQNYLGYNGVANYTLTDGFFKSNGVTLAGAAGGGTCHFTQNGGTSKFASDLKIGSGGGAGTFTQSAGSLSGNLIYVGVDSGTGVYNMSGGTASVTHFLAGANSAGTLTMSDGELTCSGYFEISGYGSGTGLVTLSGGTISAHDVLIAGQTGTGTLNQSGGLLKVTGGNITAAGTAQINLSGGEIKMGGGTIGSVGILLSGGTLTNASSVGALALSGASAVINSDTTNGTVTGIMSGVGAGFTKIGAGKLTLSNANTYTGNTSVAEGTLAVTGSLQSNVNVSAGAVLGGSGSVKSVNGVAGAILKPGDPTTLNILGDLTWAGTLETLYDGGDAQPVSLVAVTGNVDATGATFDFTQTGAALTLPSYTFLTYGGTLMGAPAVTNLPTGYHVEYLSGSVVLAVPEPSTLILLALGLIGVAAYIRRR